jgi:hypothetical protein
MDRPEEPAGMSYIYITFDQEAILLGDTSRIEVSTSVSKLTVMSILRYMLAALDKEDQGTDMA